MITPMRSSHLHSHVPSIWPTTMRMTAPPVRILIFAVLLATLLVFGVAGCSGGSGQALSTPPAAPAAGETATAPAGDVAAASEPLLGSGSAMQAGTGTPLGRQPTITLSPNHGCAGTEVVVSGELFPPGSEVQVRLGGLNTAATSEHYASAVAAADGRVQISFTMPSHWPNGDPITSPQITIMVSTVDFVDKASEVFEYETPGSPGN